MSDDLVKRLRDFDPHLHEWEVVDEAADRIDEAADRIEQLEWELYISRMAQVVMDNSVAEVEALTTHSKTLTAERDEAQADWRKYEGAWMTAEGRLADAEAERDRLRKALTVYADPCDEFGSSPCGFEGNMCCRTARDALKGIKDEN